MVTRKTVFIKHLHNLKSAHRLSNKPSSSTENVILRDMRGTDLFKELGDKKICTKIRSIYINYWIEEFVNWLIDGNEYQFVYKQIFMRIVNRDTKSKKFKYRIDTRGLDPILFVKISHRLFYRNKRYYLAKMKGDMLRRVEELTKRGIEFLPLKQSGYVNFK